MSRKDYIHIADNLHHYFEHGAFYTNMQVFELVASCLKGTNPRFDRGRFVRRCMQGMSDSAYARKRKAS